MLTDRVEFGFGESRGFGLNIERRPGGRVELSMAALPEKAARARLATTASMHPHSVTFQFDPHACKDSLILTIVYPSYRGRYRRTFVNVPTGSSEWRTLPHRAYAWRACVP